MGFCSYDRAGIYVAGIVFGHFHRHFGLVLYISLRRFYFLYLVFAQRKYDFTIWISVQFIVFKTFGE